MFISYFVGVYDFDGLYTSLFTSSHDLIEIKAKYVSDGALRALSPCLQLSTVELDLCHPGKLTNEGMETLAANCPSLTSLSLRMRTSSQSPTITDAAVQAIVENCPRIQTLTLYGLTLLTDLSMRLISTLTELKELDVAACDKFTSAGIPSLVQSCPNLELLKVSVHSGNTNDVIKSVGICCRHLKVFSFYYDSHDATVADTTRTLAAFKGLVKGCPLLEDLNVTTRNRYDDVTLALVAEFCPRLRRTYLLGDMFTDQGLIALSRGCPDLGDFHIASPYITDAGVLSLAEH